jgi:hypothetical protein
MAAAEATPIAADKPKRKQVNRNQGPRPAYVLVNLPEGVDPADITVVGVTRKAEEALEAIDTGRATKYLRLMVK